MNAHILKQLLEKGDERVLLLDVREPKEVVDEPYFEVQPENYLTISLTILSVLPKEELMLKIHEAIDRLRWKEPDVRIVTLCRSGRRSEMACASLQQLPFPVESLEGGRDAWIRERA